METTFTWYQPGRQPRLPLDSDLQFIQVLWSHGPSVVDSTTGNPFYGSGSGLTSIHGKQSVSFYDNPAMDHRASSHLPPSVFWAEVFLAQDTGINDARTVGPHRSHVRFMPRLSPVHGSGRCWGGACCWLCCRDGQDRLALAARRASVR
jgi:hypothetical protein